MTGTLPLFDGPMDGIMRRLRAVHGDLPPRQRLDPLSQMVLSLISCRTKDEESGAAFDVLVRQFGSWDEARRAPVGLLADILSRTTWPQDKARFVQASLNTVMERRGSLDLGFLSEPPIPEARTWLESLPGVGPKISASILCFSTLARPVLPIDTHNHRVAARLGLIPAKADDRKADRLLNDLIPKSWDTAAIDSWHCLVKIHSQTVCAHDRPLCGNCVFRDVCRWPGHGANAQKVAEDRGEFFGAPRQPVGVGRRPGKGVMAAAEEADAAHSRVPGRLDAGARVLHDDAIGRIETHRGGGVKKQIGSGLSVRHHRRAEQAPFEPVQQARDLQRMT